MEPFPPANRTLLAVYCVEFGCRRGGYDDESVCCVVKKWPCALQSANLASYDNLEPTVRRRGKSSNPFQS